MMRPRKFTNNEAAKLLYWFSDGEKSITDAMAEFRSTGAKQSVVRNILSGHTYNHLRLENLRWSRSLLKERASPKQSGWQVGEPRNRLVNGDHDKDKLFAASTEDRENMSLIDRLNDPVMVGAIRVEEVKDEIERMRKMILDLRNIIRAASAGLEALDDVQG